MQFLKEETQDRVKAVLVEVYENEKNSGKLWTIIIIRQPPLLVTLNLHIF
jgi:hypothetical protein